MEAYTFVLEYIPPRSQLKPEKAAANCKRPHINPQGPTEGERAFSGPVRSTSLFNSRYVLKSVQTAKIKSLEGESRIKLLRTDCPVDPHPLAAAASN
eukprot:7817426-Pyramimonas_sp.AAC.1